MRKFDEIQFFFQGDADPKKLIEKDVMNIIENRDSLTESEYHNLTLSKDGMLGQNQFSITWKGMRDENESIYL